MNIIRNNKKIIKRYLCHYFIFDLFQAIPLYTIIRIFTKPNDYFSLDHSKGDSFIIIFLLIIKPFKIFKIVRKKYNMALEDFYSYLSENYYLEKMARFLVYFLVFFLFLHLFICLHIYFTYQDYPNWINHTNILKPRFFDKYIASLYFMITTMTTVGYGDIVCISFIERIYHIILLVIGTLFYTFLVSKIGNYLRDQSYEAIKLGKDLNILENIRVAYPTMSYDLYSKIKKHLLSIYNKRKKTGISLLIDGIPDAIKNDLLFKIYSKVINGFNIFKNVNNSNFVLQVLTSFIPIVSKKEEIIILEGEIIHNIVFVRDGKLSIEISLDLNDPYKSIEKYREVNFTGITKNEIYNIKDYLSRNITNMNRSDISYSNLKAEIDKVILDNKNSIVNNLKSENNDISVDLGRLDFSRNEIDNYNNNNFHIIKILDVRKNEHFGDLHLITEKPSPFTLKAKSRIVELLLLRKSDALTIFRNFPNIWRRIQSKSYHNLISIKKLTLKILKRYYNTYFYNSNKREAIANLDITKGSLQSEDLSIMKRLKTLNKNKNVNISKNNILENSYLKSKKTIFENEKKRKIIGNSFSKELKLNDEFDSNTYNNSNYNNTNSIIQKKNKKNHSSYKLILNEENKNKNMTRTLSLKNSNLSENSIDKSSRQIENKNNLGNSTKNESDNKKFLKLISINKSKTKSSNFGKSSKILDNYNNILKTNYNSKKISDKTFSSESSLNDTIRLFSKNNKEIKNENNDINILTLEDVDKDFSKRIKKKLKKRKKSKN